MTQKFLYLVPASLIISLIFLVPVPASAHQSGCHRWHSCPSDTGSYVCGDLGYTSGCSSKASASAAVKKPVKELKSKAKVKDTKVAKPAKKPKASKAKEKTKKVKTKNSVGEKVYVDGYYRKDGTYVKGYWRKK